MLVLSKKIMESYPHSFNSFMVLGKRGIGKSCYSMIALHDALVSLGLTDNQAWNAALKCLQFTIPEVISFLESAVSADQKQICMIWDDCRVYASGSQYFLQMKMVSKLSGLLDVIRTGLSTLILTMPSAENILSILKSYDSYVIKVHYNPEKGGYYRLCTGYLWSSLPSGSKRIYKKFEDDTSIYIPKWVFDRYMDRRKKVFQTALAEMKATEKTVKE